MSKKIVYLIALLVLIYLGFKVKEARVVGTSGSPSQNENLKGDVASDGGKPSDIPQFSDVEAKQFAANKAEVPMANMDSVIAQNRERSDRVIQNFENISRMSFKSPDNMVYEALDSSLEGVEGVYGMTADGSAGLAVFASYLNVSDSDVVKFVRESSDEIPNLKDQSVSWNPEKQSFPVSGSSGLSEAKVWTGQKSNGEVVAAVLMNRKDGKGLYLFVYNSKDANAFENEDYFQMLLNDVKASP